jgi:NADH-quinone oxidoreductase subunit H
MFTLATSMNIDLYLIVASLGALLIGMSKGGLPMVGMMSVPLLSLVMSPVKAAVLLLPLFVIYVISAVAETNRHPFDVVEGESEIVAGHMVEYSGMAFALFFLGEYANMIFLSCMAAIMFLGGWAAPIELAPLTWVPGWLWLGLKTFVVVSLFIWFRASFPRYRYDQIMRLGWKIFIPLTGVWLVVVAIWMQTPWNIWK